MLKDHHRLQLKIDQHKTYRLCTNCDRSRGRMNVCLYRNSIPADVLFIGDKPSLIDDSIGKPLMDLQGQILNEIIEAANVYLERGSHTPFTTCITTRLSCYAQDESTVEEEEACLPRLLDLIRTVSPRLLVLVGIEQLINLATQKTTVLDIEFLSSLPIAKIVDPLSLADRAEQFGKDPVVPIFRQQVSTIVNAWRRVTI